MAQDLAQFAWRNISRTELFWICLLLISWPPRMAMAQEQEPPETDDVSPQVWIDYNPSVFLNDKLELFGDVGARRELGSG